MGFMFRKYFILVLTVSGCDAPFCNIYKLMKSVDGYPFMWKHPASLLESDMCPICVAFKARGLEVRNVQDGEMEGSPRWSIEINQ
jgi:hypothetical protein